MAKATTTKIEENDKKHRNATSFEAERRVLNFKTSVSSLFTSRYCNGSCMFTRNVSTLSFTPQPNQHSQFLRLRFDVSQIFNLDMNTLMAQSALDKLGNRLRAILSHHTRTAHSFALFDVITHVFCDGEKLVRVERQESLHHFIQRD